ncbi:hypothetical protein [Mucilaginibacter pedocola]|uniref:Uncharacterized protein n=1 Tax=Mucilaginibacter pedocola TaxID=1792845 RepID=A0A1S9PCJ3_9SPHI|nr:hypothetical protein [Mucilaginibacter pedocola]OOQ58308.1 hypothetical protein BC343_11785 [Mucilaginibacter pedocola]
MKGKKLDSPLLAAILIIWGMIIYPTVSAFSSQEDAPVITTATAKQSINDYSIKTDNNKLGLHYRGPFWAG